MMRRQLILEIDSVDLNKVYKASRYGSDDDYYNCPMNKEEYLNFWNELVKAETTPLKEFEKAIFEGCMPVEEMASRGVDTLRYGPLKASGLRTSCYW